MMISLVDTNPETGEETLIQTLNMDISGLIYSSTSTTLEWNFNTLTTSKVHNLKITLTSSGPFLSDYFKKKLNPLFVKISACKQIP